MSLLRFRERLEQRLRARADQENLSVEELLEYWLESDIPASHDPGGADNAAKIEAHGSATEMARQHSESRYKALFQASPVAMFIIDRFDEKVELVNHKFTELCGYTLVDIPAIAQWWLVAFPDPVYRAAVLQQLTDRTDKVVCSITDRIELSEVEAMITCKDGSTRYVEMRLSLLDDKHLVTLEDLTRYRQLEFALRESEQRYSVISNLVLSYACAYRYLTDDDDSAHLEWVVGAFEQVTGHKIEEALHGFSLSLPVHPDDVAMFRERQHRLHTGQPDTGEFRILGKHGDVRWLRSYGLPEWDAAQQRVIRVYVGVQDITELKKLHEQAFALAIEREHVKLLNQFVENASHELRTPLTILNLSVHTITATSDPQRRLYATEQAGQQIKRLAHLMDTVLITTRLDSNPPFTFEATDVNGLVEEVLLAFGSKIAAKTLNAHFEPALSLPKLRIDEDWMTQALEQILDNAIRFTPNAGKIDLRTRRGENYVALDIQDTGIGIDAEALPHIFERFWRQDKAHSTPGFGLGLCIAQKIIECHGGKIEVESAIGIGTLFRILLPIPNEN